MDKCRFCQKDVEVDEDGFCEDCDGSVSLRKVRKFTKEYLDNTNFVLHVNCEIEKFVNELASEVFADEFMVESRDG